MANNRSAVTGVFGSIGGFNPAVPFPGTVINPGTIRPDLPGLVIFPGTIKPPTTAEQPPTPTASTSDLQVLIAAVPIAQDGHVITAEYHNALRNALMAIANRLGLGPVSEEITITNAPHLLRDGNVPEWELQYGFARRLGAAPPAGGTIHGWMELDLPDGARIKKMVAFATREGAGALKVTLRRQKVTEPRVAPDLIVIDIAAGADAARGTEADVTVPAAGAGAAAIEEYRVVNNREHKYLFTAELDHVDNSTTAEIRAIQIVCGF
jgi:hypothetical protein